MKIVVLCFFILLLSWADAAQKFFPKSFSAKYQESYIGSLRGKEITSEGTLDYQYPGKLIYRTDVMVYVTDQKTSWLYRPPFIEDEEGTVTISSAKGAHHLGRFFDMLKNGLISNNDYQVELKGQQATFSFSEKNQKSLGIKKAILYAKTKEIKQFSDIEKIETFDKADKKKTLKFLAFTQDISFPAGHFVFNIPPKTKRINKD